ncbi:MAG: F0F1 ATP synthase subunit B, partial [Clostridia bacterium]|nr:F0F1 ATP synthase subunit B [Clostridia bacterium]
MQSQDIINVNIWLILISLCNLVILFLILKKFLFKPVKKVLEDRQAEYDAEFAKAEQKLSEAEKVKAELDAKFASADDEADRIIKEAKDNAARRESAIVSDAKEKAAIIVKNAETEADMRRRKADETIKDEIADVSVEIAEKIIGREI